MARLQDLVGYLNATRLHDLDAARAHRVAVSLAALALLVVSAGLIPWRATGQGGATVTAVSAASFEPVPVAPEAIVSAFGPQLAARTEVAAGLPLPTELAGTSLLVNGRAASLFFVSPNQINFLIPENTAAGTANLVVRAGAATIATGAAQIARVAPGVFTANASGQGVAAAVALRLKPGGAQVFEEVAQRDASTGRFVTRPIAPGGEGEQVFLILYLTGIRRADDPNGDGNLAIAAAVWLMALRLTSRSPASAIRAALPLPDLPGPNF